MHVANVRFDDKWTCLECLERLSQSVQVNLTILRAKVERSSTRVED